MSTRSDQKPETARQQHLSERRLAERWDVSQRTLQRWRTDNYGPAWLRIGGNIRYRLEDVLAYEMVARSGGGR